jgi:hypothetical protein
MGQSPIEANCLSQLANYWKVARFSLLKWMSPGSTRESRLRSIPFQNRPPPTLVTDSMMAVESQSMSCKVADFRPAKLRIHRRDNELTAALKTALQKTGYQSLAKIRVDVEHGRVRLRGKVPNYFMKQTAQEAIRKVAVGLKIDNQTFVQET